MQARVTILVSEQYAGPILRIVNHGYILKNGWGVLEGNSQELLDNPDVKSAYCGLWAPDQTFHLLIGEGLMGLRFLGDDFPKKKDKGKKTHS